MFDIVSESLVQAWFNGKNFIEYCLNLSDNVDACIVVHIVWYGSINEFNIVGTLYSIKVPSKIDVTDKILILFNESFHIIKEKDRVSFYMKNLNERILHVLAHWATSFSCTNIFYILHEDVDIMYEEEYIDQ
ncbi:hypothetical protein J4526_02610 [Desulfurococcaceae archaeon MEX13E-LK6-19]|nr:hypothetical protein J4526_02610 [Desulfurococcaceae archaeon MEX13E-LK6-19]